MAPALLRSGTEGAQESGVAGTDRRREDDSALESGGDSHCAMIGADSQRVSCPSTRSRAPRVLTGVDVVDIERLRFALTRYPRLEKRLFSEAERVYAASRKDPVRHLAARFAAKEAVGKLLGCGVTSWQDILVEGGGSALGVLLVGRAADQAKALGLGPIALSLSHAATIAVASAVALAERG